MEKAGAGAPAFGGVIKNETVVMSRSASVQKSDGNLIVKINLES